MLRIREAGHRAHRSAFAEHGEDLGAGSEVELVHARQYELSCLTSRIKLAKTALLLDQRRGYAALTAELRRL